MSTVYWAKNEIEDEESNNYETSEVRKFLLNWFEERQELN